MPPRNGDRSTLHRDVTGNPTSLSVLLFVYPLSFRLLVDLRRQSIRVYLATESVITYRPLLLPSMNDGMFDDDADLIDQVSDDEDMDDAPAARRQRGTRSRTDGIDDEPPLQGYTR